MPGQKRIELQHIECLKSIYPQFPKGTENPDGEEPDYVITEEDGKIVGIEHTQLFRNSSSDTQKNPMQIDSEREKTVEGAGKIYQGNNHPPVNVMVSFFSHYSIAPKRRRELASILAKFVGGHLPKQDSYETHENSGLDDCEIPKEVNSIRIARFSELNENCWSVLGGTYVPKLEEGQIRDLVGKKENKLDQYRKSANIVWLLIVISGFNASSVLDVPSNIRAMAIQTNFDKVIILRYFEREIIELQNLKPIE